MSSVTVCNYDVVSHVYSFGLSPINGGPGCGPTGPISYTPNNGSGHDQLQARLRRLMQGQRRCSVHGDSCHVGLFGRSLFVGQRIPLAGVAHQCGTVRFGHDPTTSALDVHCKAHDVDNLYVVDGSFFPSSGAVNPALTIMANALRVGDHLAARLA